MVEGSDHHLVHAYLDGELDVATALAVEQKIGIDVERQKLAGEVRILKKALAEAFPAEALPTHGWREEF